MKKKTKVDACIGSGELNEGWMRSNEAGEA